MEYEVKQIPPNHADHISCYNDKFILSMFEQEAVIAQPKYDGERMLIHIDHGKVYCTSRRFSKKTGRYMENQDKLGALRFACKDFDVDYTVLDCECYAKNWSTIVGILHSLPERAEELQKLDTAKFAVFDCLFINGKDIRNEPYIERLRFAKQVVETIHYEPMHLIEFMNNDYQPDSRIYKATTIKSYLDWQTCMTKAVETYGFEGIVIKSLNKTYYDKGASLKCKKFETVDLVVIDYQQGRGKYENTIGALVVGYYEPETNSFVRVSNVNCSTDEERQYWKDNWTKLQYSVIEVKCQEITDKSLRHPVYVRRRNDKDYAMCTKQTIFKESE